jgi:translation initiation factor IF-1
VPQTQLWGTVTAVLPNDLFRVELENGRTAVVHVAGRLRMELVRLIPGDTVHVELSGFDRDKGRVIARERRR